VTQIIESIRGIADDVGYRVGLNGVTKIEFYERNYGDHGVGQFDVYKGSVLHSSVMHRALAEVVYSAPEEGTAP